VTTPSKASLRSQIEATRGKKRWGHFSQQAPSVENVSSTLPNPSATTTKKYRISDFKNFGISFTISKTS
jgi:hypothetical protein